MQRTPPLIVPLLLVLLVSLGPRSVGPVVRAAPPGAQARVQWAASASREISGNTGGVTILAGVSHGHTHQRIDNLHVSIYSLEDTPAGLPTELVFELRDGSGASVGIFDRRFMKPPKRGEVFQVDYAFPSGLTTKVPFRISLSASFHAMVSAAANGVDLSE